MDERQTELLHADSAMTKTKEKSMQHELDVEQERPSTSSERDNGQVQASTPPSCKATQLTIHQHDERLDQKNSQREATTLLLRKALEHVQGDCRHHFVHILLEWTAELLKDRLQASMVVNELSLAFKEVHQLEEHAVDFIAAALAQLAHVSAISETARRTIVAWPVWQHILTGTALLNSPACLFCLSPEEVEQHWPEVEVSLWRLETSPYAAEELGRFYVWLCTAMSEYCRSKALEQMSRLLTTRPCDTWMARFAASLILNMDENTVQTLIGIVSQLVNFILKADNEWLSQLVPKLDRLYMMIHQNLQDTVTLIEHSISAAMQRTLTSWDDNPTEHSLRLFYLLLTLTKLQFPRTSKKYSCLWHELVNLLQAQWTLEQTSSTEAQEADFCEAKSADPTTTNTSLIQEALRAWKTACISPREAETCIQMLLENRPQECQKSIARSEDLWRSFVTAVVDHGKSPSMEFLKFVVEQPFLHHPLVFISQHLDLSDPFSILRWHRLIGYTLDTRNSEQPTALRPQEKALLYQQLDGWTDDTVLNSGVCANAWAITERLTKCAATCDQTIDILRILQSSETALHHVNDNAVFQSIMSWICCALSLPATEPPAGHVCTTLRRINLSHSVEASSVGCLVLPCFSLLDIVLSSGVLDGDCLEVIFTKRRHGLQSPASVSSLPEGGFCYEVSIGLPLSKIIALGLDGTQSDDLELRLAAYNTLLRVSVMAASTSTRQVAAPAIPARLAFDKSSLDVCWQAFLEGMRCTSIRIPALCSVTCFAFVLAIRSHIEELQADTCGLGSDQAELGPKKSKLVPSVGNGSADADDSLQTTIYLRLRNLNPPPWLDTAAVSRAAVAWQSVWVTENMIHRVSESLSRDIASVAAKQQSMFMVPSTVVPSPPGSDKGETDLTLTLPCAKLVNTAEQVAWSCCHRPSDVTLEVEEELYAVARGHVLFDLEDDCA
eukprot:m.194418 g.194418  ORF g.194418 m.194418 type:complete len:953 (-) comp16790_c0_seq6:522-3380(-)